MQIEELCQGNQLSMRNISQENIGRIQVPIPPKGEIDAAIARYDLLVGEAADADRSASEAQAAYTQLRQSILKAAFAGRLVPQDPEDEPAAALLARLRKSEIAANMRGRRRRADRRQLPLPDLSEDAAGAGYIKSH